MMPNIIDLIKLYSKGFNLEPEMVAAFVEIESRGETTATRFEPESLKYTSEINVAGIAELLRISEDVERKNQMTSWGLLQVMGYNARDMNFLGDLEELLEPTMGLEMGCSWIRELQKRFDFSLGTEGILGFSQSLACAYNHGRPQRNKNGQWIVQSYVDKVKAAYDKFKSEGIS